MENKHYALLVLAMSCNEPFFVESRRVTHDTWAKDLILGSYENIGFYSYTASETGEEYIKDNTIYLNCGDKLENTFEKTMCVFDFLNKNNITFDYVLRTNTSTYINLPMTIDKINTLIALNCDLSGLPICNVINYYESPILSGQYLFISNTLIQKILSRYKNGIYKNYVNWHIDGVDDVEIANHVLDILQNTNLNIKLINYIDQVKYKSITRNNLYKEEANAAFPIHTDPLIVNNVYAVNYRLSNIKQTSMYRYIELEHAYELHEANRYVINR
jgi:hypothetical protein